MIGDIVIIIIGIVLFFVLRNVNLWYWKINENISLQREILGELKKISRTEKIKETKETSKEEIEKMEETSKEENNFDLQKAFKEIKQKMKEQNNESVIELSSIVINLKNNNEIKISDGNIGYCYSIRCEAYINIGDYEKAIKDAKEAKSLGFGKLFDKLKKEGYIN